MFPCKDHSQKALAITNSLKHFSTVSKRSAKTCFCILVRQCVQAFKYFAKWKVKLKVKHDKKFRKKRNLMTGKEYDKSPKVDNLI